MGAAGSTLGPLLVAVVARELGPLLTNIVVIVRSSSAMATELGVRKINGEVLRQKGPYAASGNWWDEQAWEREEWDVELEDGALCQCHSHAGQWELDGVYD